MTPIATVDDLLALLRTRVDRAWLEAFIGTPDGEAWLLGLLDMWAAVDSRDGDALAGFALSAHSRQIGDPASGARTAAVTLRVRRVVNDGRPRVLPAGTKVWTRPDGHVFKTDADVTFGAAEVGVWKSVTASAGVDGWVGVIPECEIVDFVPVAQGLSGVGLAMAITQTAPPSAQPNALQFRCDLTVPHPFKAELAASRLYVEIVSVSTPLANGNLGRQLQIERVTSGATYASATAPENEYAWGESVDTTTDARYAAWYTAAHTFVWAARDWNELGFEVESTTAVSGGREGILDELAKQRGRARLAGESDEAVRARLEREPQGPTPLGVLRKAINVLNGYGFSRHDVRVYELGATAPDAVDPYAENFPAAGGFIADMHCADMSTPETPDGMASASPTYSVLSPFYNPGLAFALYADHGVPPRGLLVRWTPPGGMAVDDANTVRRLLVSSAKRAVAPGTFVGIYEPTLWGY